MGEEVWVAWGHRVLSVSPARAQRGSACRAQEHGVLQGQVHAPAPPTLELWAGRGESTFLYLGCSICKTDMITHLICGAVGGED